VWTHSQLRSEWRCIGCVTTSPRSVGIPTTCCYSASPPARGPLHSMSLPSAALASSIGLSFFLFLKMVLCFMVSSFVNVFDIAVDFFSHISSDYFLFSAILESGPYAGWSSLNMSVSETHYQAMVNQLGCTSNGNGAQQVACLRSKSAGIG
jgi:hypothetical protein